ncbi:MAG: cytochrome c [Saprospiraceae bacterium]|nr:cytochrome c [Saprospiraceae bacterium]
MRKTVYYIVLPLMAIFAASCGNKTTQEGSSESTEAPQSMVKDASDYDPSRGEGKYTAENVILGATLDGAMAEAGSKIQGVKCSSCHKLTDEKLVGPGWKGVTERRKPEWILNFITNPDPMIDKDPEVQAQLELCLVRMPNQNLQDQEARSVLEFMRKNDGVK